MIVESVTYRVRPGRDKEFEQQQAEWEPVLRRARGFITRSLMRNVDDPLEYRAEVRWASRAYRDRFAAAEERDTAALRRKAAALIDGTPAARLFEGV